MYKKLLIIILISMNNFCLASSEYRAIWKDLYDPTSKIRDIVFDIKSEKIEELIKEKLVTHKIKDFALRYYWIKNNLDLKVVNSEKLPEETTSLIKKQFLNKIELVVGSDFDQFVNGYEYVGVKHGWYEWEDPTGLKDVGSFKMKREKKQINIIQKKATGTIKTKYFLKKTSWSANKFIFWKIDKTIQEGAYNIKIQGKVEYMKKNNLWLPKKLTMATKHNLNENSDQDITRSMDIIYHFVGYKVNTSEALRWFSTR